MNNPKSTTYETAMQAVAKMDEGCPFEISQPAWIKAEVTNEMGQCHYDPTCYIVMGTWRGVLGGWFCEIVPEDRPTMKPYIIKTAWLTDLCPGEPRTGKVVCLDRFRKKKPEPVEDDDNLEDGA